MAKNTIADLDTTASNNTDVLNQSTQGTAAVSTIDTMIQNSLGLLARFYADLGGTGTVGGTADAITLTTASTYQALENGLIVTFKAGSANTGAATINVDSLGAKAIRRIGDSALSAGDIAANGVYLLRYDTTYNGAAGAWILLNSGSVYFPTGHLYGLTLSNNGTDATNDIDIAAGTARDSTDSANMVLASALTKRLDATWAVGTNEGMLASGAAIADTTYHIFLIKRTDTGVVDIAADTSVTGANVAANTDAAYTLRRRIGSILRESGSIVPFFQTGRYFARSVPANSINVTNPGTSAVLRTLAVPVGLKLLAKMAFYFEESASPGNNAILVTDPDQADTEPSLAAFSIFASILNNGVASATLETMTNTSAQVRIRQRRSNANTFMRGVTHGWTDEGIF